MTSVGEGQGSDSQGNKENFYRIKYIVRLLSGPVLTVDQKSK